MTSVEYSNLQDLIADYNITGRSESAAFLGWYLENFYKLERLEAQDCICDQRGDKGVDGIFVNENTQCIEIFQAKISKTDNSSIGDTALKEFFGTLSQFDAKDSVETLCASAPNSDVVKLIKRLQLINLVNDYDVRGVFLSNLNADSNGAAYLDIAERIEFIGKDFLEKNYLSPARQIAETLVADFDISGTKPIIYELDEKTKAVIVPLKATQLAHMPGIGDQSAFELNVRGPLGRTQINRGIAESIKTKKRHKSFLLFHNGITIICKEMEYEESKSFISLKGYNVVNGCQSLTSLFQNKAFVSDDLSILAKIITVGEDVTLSQMITQYSNFQNGVKPRDLRANNRLQIALQREFKREYNGVFAYEIKRGEPPTDHDVISNEEAGIQLIAFDLKEPWTTHRKYRVFEDAYNDIFARPEVNSHRIVFLKLLYNVIKELSGKIENKLFATYKLSEYFIMYCVRLLLESDEEGRKMIADPKCYVESTQKREALSKIFSIVVNDIIIDINGELKTIEENFDYRGKLRDHVWVTRFAGELISSYLKQVQRERIKSVEQEYQVLIGEH